MPDPTQPHTAVGQSPPRKEDTFTRKGELAADRSDELDTAHAGPNVTDAVTA